jgi:hypothetical protein
VRRSADLEDHPLQGEAPASPTLQAEGSPQTGDESVIGCKVLTRRSMTGEPIRVRASAQEAASERLDDPGEEENEEASPVTKIDPEGDASPGNPDVREGFTRARHTLGFSATSMQVEDGEARADDGWISVPGSGASQRTVLTTKTRSSSSFAATTSRLLST